MPIKGFESRYEISNFGRVMSKNKDGKTKILKNYLGTWSYYTIHLGRKFRSILVHRIVADHFVENPNPEKFTQINHLDGDKTNNKASNLEWCDQSRNTTHAFETGLNSGVSETHYRAKLTNDDILDIKRMAGVSGMSQSKIAAIYDLNPCHVSRIVNNKRRKYG